MHDIATVAADLTVFQLGVSEPDAMAGSMRVLEAFNQCALGVIRFTGATEWERHPDDEFLYVVGGEVEIVFRVGEERRQAVLRPGHACVVPAGAWHRQYAPDGVTLIYITSRGGTDHASAADDPPCWSSRGAPEESEGRM